MPRPVVLRGAPPQGDGEQIPPRGLAIVVATDSDTHIQRQFIASLPLTSRDFVAGSAPAGSPLLDAAWFRAHGGVFVVTVKYGAHAYHNRQVHLVDRILRTLR